MSKSKRRLGEILYKKGYVGKEKLIEAIKKGKKVKKRLGEVLIADGLATEEQVFKALAKQFGFEFVDLDKVDVPADVTKLVPEDIIKKHSIIPLSQDNGELRVVIKDPMDLDTLDLLRFRLNMEMRCCLASPTKIDNYIEGASAVQESTDEYRSSIDQTAEELRAMGHAIEAEVRRAQATDDEVDDGPIVRLANLIIDEAVRMGASDIHVEPMADRVRIRYRVDGVCIERDNIPKNMQPPLLARLKILSGMDIGERRLPQDGRIKRTIDDQDIDFRASCLPGYHGESTVLRILRPESVNIGIQAIGFDSDDYERFTKIIKQPNGIFLVTGPTGSGKTTTLYSALQELNRPDKKIITAEDPVEYNIGGINQCQVRTDIGLTFESILRSMLRQAPNIILIGEIRDGVVADIAIQAALTGHLVFSTLHTNPIYAISNPHPISHRFNMNITGPDTHGLIDNQICQPDNRAIVSFVICCLGTPHFGLNGMTHRPQFFGGLVNTAAVFICTFLNSACALNIIVYFCRTCQAAPYFHIEPETE